MSESFSVAGFVICFPVWSIANGSHDVISDVLRAEHPDGEIAVPVFTDEDAARTFLERTCPEPQLYVAIPFGPLPFIGLLNALQTKGVTHVLFDAATTKGTSIPISIAIAGLSCQAVRLPA